MFINKVEFSIKKRAGSEICSKISVIAVHASPNYINNVEVVRMEETQYKS